MIILRSKNNYGNFLLPSFTSHKNLISAEKIETFVDVNLIKTRVLHCLDTSKRFNLLLFFIFVLGGFIFSSTCEFCSMCINCLELLIINVHV